MVEGPLTHAVVGRRPSGGPPLAPSLYTEFLLRGHGAGRLECDVDQIHTAAEWGRLQAHADVWYRVWRQERRTGPVLVSEWALPPEPHCLLSPAEWEGTDVVLWRGAGGPGERRWAEAGTLCYGLREPGVAGALLQAVQRHAGQCVDHWLLALARQPHTLGGQPRVRIAAGRSRWRPEAERAAWRRALGGSTLKLLPHGTVAQLLGLCAILVGLVALTGWYWRRARRHGQPSDAVHQPRGVR